MPYNYNPSPQPGNGAFGAVPGATTPPPSIWDQLNSNIPGYGAMTNSATGDIQSQLNGTLSPSTMSNIGNYAASRGVSLGQPNSPMMNEIGMNVTGTTTEGLEQQGLGNYNTFTGTAGGAQLNPETAAGISESNAQLAAAPDPATAAMEQQSLFDKYLSEISSPAGGSGFGLGIGQMNPATGRIMTSGWNSGPAAITNPGAGQASAAQYYL